MKLWKSTSINQKLTLLVMAAVTAALALSYAAFAVNNVRILRRSMVTQLSTLAEVLGSNSAAAVTFDDNKSAEEILHSLRLLPMVEWAAIYDASGEPFATYASDDVHPPAEVVPQELGHKYAPGGHLDVSETIVVDGERIGTIHLRANSDAIYAQMRSYAVIMGCVLLLSFGASYVVTSRLQRRITGPILKLAHTAEQISAEQNYALRVAKTSDDELGMLYDQFNRMLEKVETTQRQLQNAHDQLERRVEERTCQLSETNEELSKEVAERRRAEDELERVNRDFVTSARRAGMAEVAIGVLHNVGNVLNSVNVSTALVAGRLKSSKRNQLNRIATLLDEHRADLAEFVTRDERGKQVPNFLTLLAQQLEEDEVFLLKEMESLASNVEHIKTIIVTQQSYATISGMVEPINVNAVLEDAVRLNSTSFGRHHIHVEREFAALPMVLIDRQRLLQIVINLVKNSKEALVEQKEHERTMTLRTQAQDDRLIIEICDTGIGISEENLTRVFSHGFTTKTHGHGFGLHSCANAAAEMDGSLSARSAGPMQGAAFTLNLPLIPVAIAEATG